MSLNFVEPLERAVKNDCVTGLAHAVAALGASGAFGAPGFFAPRRSDRYARRLVWNDPEGRFVVVAMTWGPGQGSPLHDHAGLWGVEVVVSGTMRETGYRLVERDASGRYRFTRERESLSTAGMVGVLVPPLEYHAFENAGTTDAHTLHVYGGDLERCLSFDQDGDGWWIPRTVELHYSE